MGLGSTRGGIALPKPDQRASASHDLKIEPVSIEQIRDIAQKAREIREKLQTELDRRTTLTEQDLHFRVG